ncbi:hypothetical protein T265_02142 [Opisthorchis viverrini]|uniref:Uncharacterized protein n=1 Tax=Opisthorchis viverrini TaxID=6198 RepID=A0A075A7J8_OPIVI|nr:hypothetical protein T265_02142 [Opisthorchis viverrini]KER31630.1 hypothetical protein T265_02142 [Opisthorchis viverrini]
MSAHHSRNPSVTQLKPDCTGLYHGRVTTGPGQGRVSRLYTPPTDLDSTLYTPDFRFRFRLNTRVSLPRSGVLFCPARPVRMCAVYTCSVNIHTSNSSDRNVGPVNGVAVASSDDSLVIRTGGANTQYLWENK